MPGRSPYHHLVPAYFPKDKEILYHCNLIQHDHHWQSLYDVLFPYAGFEFAHHQRLLILDHDTDYYPDESSVGNNLFNLIKLFSKLDISVDHVVILTGNYGLEKDVRLLCNRYNLSCPKVIEFSQWYVYPPGQTDSFVSNKNEVQFTHLYVCLNYVPRIHRMIMMAMLHEKQLSELGIISWHSAKDINEIEILHKNNCVVSIDQSCYFRTTDPFTRINEDLNLCQKSINLMSRYRSLYDKTYKDPLITGKPNHDDTRWTGDFFNNALLFLITETVGQYRHVYFSEKTWKAIASKKPFLLLGAKNSLATLHKLGFQTFDSIWDETYDRAETTFERADLISDVLLKLADQDWQNISVRCQPIIEHNYHNLEKLQQTHLSQLEYL